MTASHPQETSGNPGIDLPSIEEKIHLVQLLRERYPVGRIPRDDGTSYVRLGYSAVTSYKQRINIGAKRPETDPDTSLAWQIKIPGKILKTLVVNSAGVVDLAFSYEPDRFFEIGTSTDGIPEVRVLVEDGSLTDRVDRSEVYRLYTDLQASREA